MYDTWCQSVSPDILNIPDIPDIPDIPVFPLFLKLLPRSPTMQNLEVLASKMAELLQFQVFSKKSLRSKIGTYRQTDLDTDRQSDLYYPLVADKKKVEVITTKKLQTNLSVLRRKL